MGRVPNSLSMARLQDRTVVRSVIIAHGKQSVYEFLYDVPSCLLHSWRPPLHSSVFLAFHIFLDSFKCSPAITCKFILIFMFIFFVLLLLHLLSSSSSSSPLPPLHRLGVGLSPTRSACASSSSFRCWVKSHPDCLYLLFIC